MPDRSEPLYHRHGEPRCPRPIERISRPGGRSADTQAANQPDHDGNDQYQTKNAAEPRPAIRAVAIVATASEQQNQHEDNQNCTHVTPYLEFSVYGFRSSTI